LNEKDIICRWGGDEFIILSPNVTHTQEVQQTKNQMEKSIEKISIPKFDLSISTGISIYPDEANTLEELIKFADKKMYREKQSTIPSKTVKSINIH
jgi:diguanylate cyclase (GGDEF)-like protein